MPPDGREEIIRRFFQEQYALMEFVRYLIPHPQDAEDVFQELAVIVMQKEAGAFPAPERFSAYCRGIARNLARQYWRHKQTQKIVYTDELCQVVDLAYQEADAQRELWDARRRGLDACLAKLPAAARQLLREHYVLGTHLVEIARRLQKSPESVRMLLLRLRNRLHECLRQQTETGGVS